MVVGEGGQLPLPWLREPLDRALTATRGHALLVQASPGIGALEFALTLAQAWLCESGAPAAARPCGGCGSCQLFRTHAHADLHLAVPEDTALAIGWPIDFDDKRKPSRQIKIDQVRAAIDWIVTTTGRGQGKVLVLHPAEAMNAAAASALLKTLEEPPNGARIVLTAADPTRLMPTVRSRCQQLTLPPPARTVAEEWLSAHGVDGAGVLLAASGGQPLDALRWHREGLGAAAWAALPRRLADGDPGVFAGWPVPRALDALSKLCHDAMRRAAGGLPTFFAANDVPKGASIESLTAWQRELQRVQRHAEHPWNEPLLVDSLTAGARAVLARRPDDKAFDTLAR